MVRNIIEEEKSIASEAFQLDMDIHGLLKLTKRNVALIEAMISIDSDYCRAADAKAGPIFKDSDYMNDAYNYWFSPENSSLKVYDGKYKGSTAYWMMQLESVLREGLEEDELKKYILMVVLAVDRDNNTHISADGAGPKFLTERIFDWLQDHPIDALKDRELGLAFIEKLSKQTPTELIKNPKYHQRENYSFATKFCHYVCFFMFQGEAEQDNYSIYDNVVAEVLPCYLSAHRIYNEDKPYTKSDFDKAKGYKKYSDVIDLLRGNRISRNGFDHLLWYYHKGRPLPTILSEHYEQLLHGFMTAAYPEVYCGCDNQDWSHLFVEQ